MDETVRFEMEYTPDEMSVERDAKIFEAGEYPDKGISIREDDLDAIVRNFDEAPVKVEHTDSPLDPLGVVKRIWRQGRELFARLAFPQDMAAFLQRRGIKSLSVALHKDPLKLAEVSLVLSPRVPTAAMFREDGRQEIGDGRPDGGDCRPQLADCSNGAETADSGNPQSELQNPQSVGEVTVNMSTDHESEIAELRFALSARDVEARLASLKARGRIVPASEAYAREILLQGGSTVNFGDGEATIAELFEKFLESQPRVVIFNELAPGNRSPKSPLPAEDEELLGKLGITRELVEKYA